MNDDPHRHFRRRHLGRWPRGSFREEWSGEVEVLARVFAEVCTDEQRDILDVPQIWGLEIRVGPRAGDV